MPKYYVYYGAKRYFFLPVGITYNFLSRLHNWQHNGGDAPCFSYVYL